MAVQPDSPVTGVGSAGKVAPPGETSLEGLHAAAIDEQVEKRIDEIEMIGEEEAAGFKGAPHSQITAGMRYLHCSRTIHQLVTDRNRAVAIYLAVASLLWTASSALLNAKPESLAAARLMVPIETVQRWCLPVTFATLAVLAVFIGFLLIRTRIGLIYEVAKMNALLGLPVGRVKRVNPLSIFFIMHCLISLAGGGSAALFALHLLARAGWQPREALVYAVPSGVAVSLLLIVLYVGTVRYTTSERKLQGGG